MRRISYIAISVVAAFAVCGCQKEIEPVSGSAGGVITFSPAVGGIQSTEITKSSTICSADGSREIPFSLSVSDGIAVTPESNPASPASILTKGEQLNTSGSDQGLATYKDQIGGKFFVSGWNSSARFIPASGSADDYAAISYNSTTSAWEAPAPYKWDGKNAPLTFYAYANLPEKEDGVLEADINCTSAAGQTFTYDVVPAAASKQYDILMGYGTIADTPEKTETECNANIKFYHPLTAVRFLKGDFDGAGSIKFKAIYINGVYKSGKTSLNSATINATNPGDKFTWTDLSTDKQEVYQEGSGYLTIDEHDFIGESFLLIPQTMTTSAPVTITLVAEIDGADYAFPLTLTSGKWEAGRTYTYKLERKHDYVFTFTDESDGTLEKVIFNNGLTCGIESIKLVESSRDGDTPLGYSAYYSIDNKNTWIPYDGATTKVSGFSADGNPGLAHGLAPKVIELMAEPKSKPADMYLWKDRDGETEMKGSASAPIDLSRLPIGGEGTEGTEQNTANCYIVKHAGYYKFPCVYGNGSYSSPVSGDYVLSTFVNAKGNPITSKYVLSDVSAANPKAALLWTDFNYGPMMLADDVQLTGSGSSAYISFRTPERDNLAEGNAVIVLYDDADNDDTYDDGEALWSWHIWVSDSNLGADNVGTVTNPTYGTASFMSRNIGWCSGIQPNGTLSVPAPYNKIDVKLVQDESGLTQEFFIYHYPVTDYGMVGNSSVFQFGRKDPFVAQIQSGAATSTGTVSRAKYFYWGDGTGVADRSFEDLSVGNTSATDGKNNVAAMVRNPGIANSYATGTDAWFKNLWSLTNNNHSTAAQNAPLEKTVYDPSPYGYVLPNLASFKCLATSDMSATQLVAMTNGLWDSSKEYIGGAIANNDDRLFFPAGGAVSESGCNYFRQQFVLWVSAPGQTNNDSYTGPADRGRALASWGQADGSSAQITYGTYNRGHLLPVRPVVEQTESNPVSGTVLYRDNFGNFEATGDNIMISSYNRNPRFAQTYKSACQPTYIATTNFACDEQLLHQRAQLSNLEDTNARSYGIGGAYLYTTTVENGQVVTVTIGNIKPWGAHKVKLSFSSWITPTYTTATCCVNGTGSTANAPRTFGSNSYNEFEFNLDGTEDTVTITFTNTYRNNDYWGLIYVDNIVLSYVN